MQKKNKPFSLLYLYNFIVHLDIYDIYGSDNYLFSNFYAEQSNTV